MGLDLVLGVHWLEALGTMMCDWKKLTMKFQWQNKPQLLHGLGAPPFRRLPWRRSIGPFQVDTSCKPYVSGPSVRLLHRVTELNYKNCSRNCLNYFKNQNSYRPRGTLITEFISRTIPNQSMSNHIVMLISRRQR